MSGVEGLAENLGRYALNAGFRFLGSDARCMAESLTADYVVIPKADLPKVQDFRDHAQVGNLVASGDDYKLNVAKRDMLSQVAWYGYLEARESARVVEEAKLAKRRDELARKFSNGTCSYDNAVLTSSTINAIDYIIAAERDGGKAS